MNYLYNYLDHEYNGNKLKVEYASYYINQDGPPSFNSRGRGGPRGGGDRGGRGRGGGDRGGRGQPNYVQSEGDWHCPDPKQVVVDRANTLICYFCYLAVVI